ncbi:SGNH/GDSL hydrolase family protein [Rhodanobacter sp. AS-Z3]|uniref:SGNH/GDSL hydrolase family protein n=1 Tax=Rhodanobacter sp. AS-Z3 TaxID=3031330 RepID=UPI00247A6916|nr:SGNH/GDSL hydrolase family protein [Rhodanobacter sp. AS-Z3]WEN15955.1 SGNH/GDSL hydrolase family protein [Rhodanobacter sp. AS-Z3]
MPAYLALGDSYTIGEGVVAEDRWPVALARQLRAEGVALDEPHLIAVTGWTTDELSRGMDETALTPPYLLVSLQIGVNNQYRGRSDADYRVEFSTLLARAITLAGGCAERVLVVSIPDWGVTRFADERGCERTAIAQELDVYNARALAECERAGARFVDITRISRAHPELVAEDGLHPSAAQYRLWLAAIAPVALQALTAAD